MDRGLLEKAEAERIKSAIKENKRYKERRRNENTAKKGSLSTGNRDRTETSGIEVTSPAFSSAGSTSVVGTSITDVESNNDLEKPSCLGCPMISLSNNYHGREATLLMHYLDVVFPLQFRFYQPLVSKGGRGWLLSILLHTRPLFHAALSVSAYHQSAFHSDSGTKFSNEILGDLQKHHCLALVELRKYIERIGLDIELGRMKTKVEILACMIFLISFDVFRGDSNDWQTHLHAARTIFMDLKDNFLLPVDTSNSKVETGHLKTPSSTSLSLEEDLALEFFATALVWFDGLSSVTTGMTSEYSNIYSSILRMENGRIQLCKLMGCQNWVMVIIMEIALLADWKNEGESYGNLSQSQLAKRVAPIEEQLEDGIRKNQAR
ncbi:hypothetical protein OCU04_007327 [Sclerotinia nivalis]|uniref:Uncharacterized protein n=1 Tax=Sclerotinia nivalis TaxID=352851 RepID=A0A9X0DIQ3_9HELO|nr:hypothetical protein OCU04_007327 [Sclerotinia nivalis]